MLVSQAIARLSCQLIGQGFRPLGFKIAITPAYLLPLGITSTNSTASNHSRAHPFQPSTQRKNTMSQHHANENINNSFNNTNSFNNVWNNCTVVDEKSEILAWLSLLEPRYGTTTLAPVGSTRWETGSYKLSNIRIGLVVSMGVNLMGRPCFDTEVRGSARPTSGREKTLGEGKKGIANKP